VDQHRGEACVQTHAWLFIFQPWGFLLM